MIIYLAYTPAVGSNLPKTGPSLLCAKSLQLCLTLCDTMDHSPPGYSVQARILEWVAISSSRGIIWTQGLSLHLLCLLHLLWCLLHWQVVLYHSHHLGSPFCMRCQLILSTSKMAFPDAWEADAGSWLESYLRLRVILLHMDIFSWASL